MAQTFRREKGLRGREMGKVPAFRVNLGSESQLYYLLVKVKVDVSQSCPTLCESAGL